MKKLNLYIKPKKNYWTRTRVVEVVLLFFIIIFIVNYYLLKNDILSSYIVYSGCVFLILATIVKLFTMGTYRTIYRKLIKNGIILEVDKITVQNQVFQLNKIESVDFILNDYYGFFIYEIYSFEPSLSNGLNNMMLITLNNGENYKYYFQRELPYEFYTSKKIFVNYYKEGKLKFKNKKEFFKFLSIDIKEEKEKLDTLIS